MSRKTLHRNQTLPDVTDYAVSFKTLPVMAVTDAGVSLGALKLKGARQYLGGLSVPIDEMTREADVTRRVSRRHVSADVQVDCRFRIGVEPY